MAIQDANLELADGQSLTTNGASTNIVDTLTLGNALKNAWFYFRVDTAAAVGVGNPLLNVQLQTSNDSSFLESTMVTLITSASFSAAMLTAKKYFAVPIPPYIKRYLRGYNCWSSQVNPNYLTAFAFDMYIGQEPNVRIDRRFSLYG